MKIIDISKKKDEKKEKYWLFNKNKDKDVSNGGNEDVFSDRDEDKKYVSFWVGWNLKVKIIF